MDTSWVIWIRILSRQSRDWCKRPVSPTSHLAATDQKPSHQLQKNI